MKVSQLINQLQTSQRLYGDLEVEAWDNNGDHGYDLADTYYDSDTDGAVIVLDLLVKRD